MIDISEMTAEEQAEEWLATVREQFEKYGRDATLAGVAMWLLELIGDDEEEGEG